MVSNSMSRASILSANVAADGGRPSSTAMYRMIRSRSESASGETMTSYMILFPNGCQGGTGVFPEACGNLPFGSHDLFVKGELGKRFVEERCADDDGRSVAVLGQIDGAFLNFRLNLGIFVSKVGDRANTCCKHGLDPFVVVELFYHNFI